MTKQEHDQVELLDLRTPAEWARVKGVRILDPDGWRGSNEFDFETPITESDFSNRAAHSSIDMRVAEASPVFAELAAEKGIPAGYGQARAHRAETAQISQVIPEAHIKVVYDLDRDAGTLAVSSVLRTGSPDTDEDGPIGEHDGIELVMPSTSERKEDQ